MSEPPARSTAEAILLHLGKSALLGVACGVVLEAARLTMRVIEYGIAMTPTWLFHVMVAFVIGSMCWAIGILIAWGNFELLIQVLGAWERLKAKIRGMRSSRGRNSSSS